MSLQELATAASLSRSAVAKIESGEIRDPGFSVVSRIWAATGGSATAFADLYRTVLGQSVPRAFGIGYEGLDQSSLVEGLRRNRVTIVADVRKTPLSRKPGMSKTALATALRDARIEYLHLPALGNPKDNRAGYSDPNDTAVRTRFQEVMAAPAATAQLTTLRELAQREVVALLCFEADERLCHRQQILAAL